MGQKHKIVAEVIYFCRCYNGNKTNMLISSLMHSANLFQPFWMSNAICHHGNMNRINNYFPSCEQT